VEEREGATSSSASTSTNTNTSTSRLHLHLRLQHSITTYSVAKDHGKLSLPKTVRGRAIVAPRCREDGVEELNDEDDEANENLGLRASSSSSRKWCVAAESACSSSVLLGGTEAY
jgi:hypothetical protein